MTRTPGDHEGLPTEMARAVARLARLALSNEALEDHRRRLASVLRYAQTLRELDLSGVEPLAHPHEATNRLDADDPRPPMPREALLGIAPAVDGPFVRVPKVIGEGA